MSRLRQDIPWLTDQNILVLLSVNSTHVYNVPNTYKSQGKNLNTRKHFGADKWALAVPQFSGYKNRDLRFTS